MIKPEKRASKDIKRVLDEIFGSMPDFLDVTKYRRFRNRKISFD